MSADDLSNTMKRITELETKLDEQTRISDGWRKSWNEAIARNEVQLIEIEALRSQLHTANDNWTRSAQQIAELELRPATPEAWAARLDARLTALSERIDRETDERLKAERETGYQFSAINQRLYNANAVHTRDRREDEDRAKKRQKRLMRLIGSQVGMLHDHDAELAVQHTAIAALKTRINRFDAPFTEETT